MGEQDDVATIGAALGDFDVTTSGLRGHLWRALARPGMAGAAEAARAASADAADLARDRLGRGDPEGALHALETARGLALFAATEVRPVTDHLAAAGKPDLARRWQAAAGVAEPQHLPADLRRDVLATLLSRSAAAALLTPPSVAEIQSALTAVDADVLVHLIPGHAVLTPASGPVTHLRLPALTAGAEHLERFLATLALHNAAASASRPFPVPGPGTEVRVSDPADAETPARPTAGPAGDNPIPGDESSWGDPVPRAGWTFGDAAGRLGKGVERRAVDPRRPEIVRPWFLTDQQGPDRNRPWPVVSHPRSERPAPTPEAQRAPAELPTPAPAAPPPVGERPSVDLAAAPPPVQERPSIDPTGSISPVEERPSVDLTSSLHALGRWSWDAVVGPLLAHLTATQVVGRPETERRPEARRFPGVPPMPLAALDAPADRPATGGDPRPPRIVLVAAGDLARVPWQAARRGDGTYALELLAISQAASARLLAHNAARPPVPPSAGGLVVADPDTDGNAGELPSARLEAYAIQQALYPRARFTGRRPDGTASPSGAGTLDQVRAWLTTSNPAAGSTLHLACTGFTRAGADRPAAYAMMAGGERLTATEVLAVTGRVGPRPIDLVVLAAGRTGLSLAGYDEAFGLGTAFLAGDVRTVLSTRWTVPEAAAPALLFMTHLFRRQGRAVWAALRAAQLWMLDPRRAFPPEMPPELAAAVTAADPSAAIAWAAVTHWGR